MIKNVEVDFKPSSEEIAEELWSMNCDEQATFLVEVARILKYDAPSFLKQLQNVADAINYGEDVCYKASIIRMLETVLEYIKAEEGDEK